jgi:uncharacterized protein with GYD domain
MEKVRLEFVNTTPQLAGQRVHSVYVSHRIYDFLQCTFVQNMKAFVRSDLEVEMRYRVGSHEWIVRT